MAKQGERDIMEGFLIFAISILTLAFVYVILCLALNIECGVAGMWDLGIVSYFGVGAYSYALIVAPEAASTSTIYLD